MEVSDSSASSCLEPEEEMKTVLHKVMVIGAAGTGRHSLLDLIFDGASENSKNDIRNPMDLIMKSRKFGKIESKYKLWIQDPQE